jgi:hypothetical protein
VRLTALGGTRCRSAGLPAIVQAVAGYVVVARVHAAVDHSAFQFFNDVRWDVFAVNVSPVVADSAIVVLDLVSANCFGFSRHHSSPVAPRLTAAGVSLASWCATCAPSRPGAFRLGSKIDSRFAFTNISNHHAVARRRKHMADSIGVGFHCRAEAASVVFGDCCGWPFSGDFASDFYLAVGHFIFGCASDHRFVPGFGLLSDVPNIANRPHRCNSSRLFFENYFLGRELPGILLAVAIISVRTAAISGHIVETAVGDFRSRTDCGS